MSENIIAIQDGEQLRQEDGRLETTPLTAIEQIRQQWEQLATFTSDPNKLNDGMEHMHKIFARVNTADLEALEEALNEQDKAITRISRLNAEAKVKQFQAELESLVKVLMDWSNKVADQKEEFKLDPIRKEVGLLPSSSDISPEVQAQTLNRISKEFLNNTVLAKVRALSDILY